MRESYLRSHAKAALSNRKVVLGLVIVGLLVLASALADWIVDVGPNKMNMGASFQAPSSEYPLGADNYGRSVLSRTLQGGRVSMVVGVCATALGMVLGVMLGLIAGYFGGWTDLTISRAIEVIMPFPYILVAIMVAFALGSNQWTIILAIGIVLVPFFARLVRGNVYAIKENQFIEAARGCGSGHLRILFSHILPHCTAPILIMASLCVAFSILTEASLSFLGLGVPPPTPTWGGDLRAGIKYLELAPWVTMSPGVAIMVSVLGFNLLGDGLRDALETEQSFLH